jgi:hypothetical protein
MQLTCEYRLTSTDLKTDLPRPGRTSAKHHIHNNKITRSAASNMNLEREVFFTTNSVIPLSDGGEVCANKLKSTKLITSTRAVLGSNALLVTHKYN